MNPMKTLILIMILVNLIFIPACDNTYSALVTNSGMDEAAAQNSCSNQNAN